MIKKWTKVLLISLLAIGGINNAFATTITEQTVFDTLSATQFGTAGGGGGPVACQTLGTGLSGTNLSLITKIRTDALIPVPGWGSDYNINLVEFSGAPSNCQGTGATYVRTFIFNASLELEGNTDYTIVIPLTAVNSGQPILDPTKYYNLQTWSFGVPTADAPKLYGSANDDYADGFFTTHHSFGGAETSDANLVEAYFKLVSGNVILIAEPIDGTTYTTTEVKDMGLEISGQCQGSTQVTMNIASISTGWVIDQETKNCQSGTFFFLVNMAGAWNDDYRITVFNFIGPGHTSDQIEITVNISGNSTEKPESALPDIEDSGNSFFVDCSAFDSTNFFDLITGEGFFCYLKKTLFAFGAFLLEAPRTVKQQFQSSLENIKGDFPFNVFFDLTGIIEENIETAPTGLTLSIYMPEPFDHTFDILTPTLMEDVVGEDFKDTVFNAITTMVWLIVGFTILAILF